MVSADEVVNAYQPSGTEFRIDLPCRILRANRRVKMLWSALSWLGAMVVLAALLTKFAYPFLLNSQRNLAWYGYVAIAICVFSVGYDLLNRTVQWGAMLGNRTRTSIIVHWNEAVCMEYGLGLLSRNRTVSLDQVSELRIVPVEEVYITVDDLSGMLQEFALVTVSKGHPCMTLAFGYSREVLEDVANQIGIQCAFLSESEDLPTQPIVLASNVLLDQSQGEISIIVPPEKFGIQAVVMLVVGMIWVGGVCGAVYYFQPVTIGGIGAAVIGLFALMFASVGLAIVASAYFQFFTTLQIVITRHNLELRRTPIPVFYDRSCDVANIKGVSIASSGRQSSCVQLDLRSSFRSIKVLDGRPYETLLCVKHEIAKALQLFEDQA